MKVPNVEFYSMLGFQHYADMSNLNIEIENMSTYQCFNVENLVSKCQQVQIH